MGIAWQWLPRCGWLVAWYGGPVALGPIRAGSALAECGLRAPVAAGGYRHCRYMRSFVPHRMEKIQQLLHSHNLKTQTFGAPLEQLRAQVAAETGQAAVTLKALYLALTGAAAVGREAA